MKRIIHTEPRECVSCNQIYDWTLRNIYGLCPDCRRKHYNKLQRGKDFQYKKPYPMAQNEKRSRHRKITADLNKAVTREERREIYRRELEFIMSNGIWEWCVDVRIPNVIMEPGTGKRGRRPDRVIALPSTKDWYE